VRPQFEAVSGVLFGEGEWVETNDDVTLPPSHAKALSPQNGPALGTCGYHFSAPINRQ
jgi:hypothetical protein